MIDLQVGDSLCFKRFGELKSALGPRCAAYEVCKANAIHKPMETGRVTSRGFAIFANLRGFGEFRRINILRFPQLPQYVGWNQPWKRLWPRACLQYL
jgi:hypothetical protein